MVSVHLSAQIFTDIRPAPTSLCMKYIVACQAHPALVKVIYTCIQSYLNGIPLIEECLKLLNDMSI